MRILLLGLVVALSGCSVFGDRFRDRSMDYLNTEEQPVMKTDGVKISFVDRYVIPKLPVEPVLPTTFSVPAPQPLVDDEFSEESVASLSDFRKEALNPRLERDGAGTLILRLDGGFAQAWAEVTDAIAASSLKLTDLNRSTGTWYLEMKRSVLEEDRSWWSQLWGTNTEVIETYLLKASRARTGVYLSLLTDADTLADEALTEAVLNEIKTKLSK